MIRALTPIAVAGLTLCGCGNEETPPPPAPDVGGPLEPAPPAPDTDGGRGGPIALEAMVFDEFSSVVEPGLGCSFDSDVVLLVASAPAEASATAQAAIKHGGVLIPLRSDGAGGFDALRGGAHFEGGGFEVVVTPHGDERQSGIETVSRDADLTVRRDGAEGAYPGVWSCGS